MSLYKHILVAIDLSDEADDVLEKAKSLAETNGARLTLVHVVEPLSVAYGSDIPLDLTTLQDEITKQAKERISKLAESIHLDKGEQHVVYGRPEREVHRIAEESDVDLIVVGSHGRHGLALILGSTSTSILHGACCDVLAVRVGKKNRHH
ncbi:universal stress protein UspA [Endozoicomonas montiporae]|uniref:Universal stress protein n=2 Tax=Endozoicomonas montiporae TaxID=1027273 RepID=A0A081NAW0_9GAMM|nr:universal stress protein [Endozoicomonas montiporae]AMO56721.1 universal stress protein A [Endozoicomonas montiporae CL-33]KEQ15583.1 universal stress protein UspA [Endozoicomonas montiporae]